MNTIDFVAHRGLMQDYPENTLIALQKALEVGGLFIEFDVHLSRDHTPVVLHDADLLRTTGQVGSVFDCDAQQLKAISAGYSECFADRFLDQSIPMLSDVVTLMQSWPQARGFVELKRRSLNHYGRDLMLDKVLEVVSTIASQVILISFDYEVLQIAKAREVEQIGWVIERWDEASREKAEQLLPSYLFADYDDIPLQGEVFWPGPWRWVVYDVVDPVIAASLVEQGVMVESKDIKRLIEAEV